MRQNYIKFFTPALVVLLGIVSYLIYSIYDKSVEGNVVVEKLTRNIEKIAYYDEVLTMSARMAVFTNDKEWVRRYNEVAPKLDGVISESKDIAPKVNTFLEKIDDVNKDLISMEMQSFEYLNQGKTDEAKSVLFGEEYLTNKKLYSDGMHSVIRELEHYRNHFRSEIEKEFLLSISIIFFILIVSIFFGKQIILYLKNTNKKLQGAVVDSEQELKNMYALSPLGIALTDMNGKYLEFNSAFEKICGYSKEELNKLDYWELTPKKYEANEAEQLESLSTTGFYGPYEKEYIKKDGTLIDIRLNGMLITDAKGEQYIWSIVEDISDQKLLQAQSESIAKIIEDSLNEVYIFDAKTLLFSYINKGAQKNIGYTLDEMKSKTAFDIKPEIDEETFHKVIEPLLDGTKEILVFETVHQRKDGSLYNVEVHLQLSTYQGKKQFVAIILDTTKARKIEKDLKEAQKISKLGSWSLDYSSGTLEWTDEIYNIFEIDKSVSPSYDLFLECIHPDDAQNVSDTFQKSIEEKTLYMVDHRIVLKDGSIKYVREQGATEFDSDGEPVKSTGTVQDITDIEKAKQELIIAKEEADNANKFKSEFLANMSHEIRTPMNGILGFVERLKKSEKDPKKLKDFEIISASGNTLLNIINDILDLSKIESGKLDLEMHSVEIYEIFTQVASIFKADLDKKQISCIRNIDNELPKYILGDEVRLKQVIFNLLSNAIKFTSENGKVILDVKFNDSKLYIAVSDTGVGIAKDKLSHIFEAFKQEDTSTTRKFGGTGLGLSISSSLVQKMGGELKVQSELGHGSKFYFEIPVEIPNVAEPIQKQQSVEEQNIEISGKILVVEDNKTNQMLLGFILDDIDAEYDIANDGVEAVKMYQAQEYALILMDENMPNMNGIESTKQIRSIEEEKSLSRIPIVAVTANALTEDRQRFLDAGMDDYISKPYQEDEMVSMVRKYLT